MKNKRIFIPLFVVLFLALITTTTATAQISLKGVTTISIGDNSGLGYTSPTFAGGLGLEILTKRFSLELTSDYSPNRKDSEKAGWSAGASALGLVRLGPVALVGGRYSYSYTKAPAWTKDAWRPSLTAGVLLPTGIGKGTARILGEYLFSGSDRSNDLTAMQMDLRLDFPHRYGSHRIALSSGLYWFHQSGNPSGPQYQRYNYAISFGESFGK